MSKYYKRIIEKELELDLQAFGGVLISGPKWCGKTTTASKYSNSNINLKDLDTKNEYLNILSTNPGLILNGDIPMLINDWQEAPQIWDYIRQDIDNRSGKGLFILTGSSRVDRTEISHSGAGRISRLLMRTLSLYES